MITAMSPLSRALFYLDGFAEGDLHLVYQISFGQLIQPGCSPRDVRSDIENFFLKLSKTDTSKLEVIITELDTLVRRLLKEKMG